MFNSKNYFSFSKKLFQFFIGITFLFLYTSKSAAQILNSNTQSDTVKVKAAAPSYHSPKKAAILSAALPGAGQVYNKKYWKLPIIYAGFAGLTYSFQFNQSHYLKYRNALKDRLNGNPDSYVGIYTTDQLGTLYKYYHRYRDLSVIGGLVLYVLNIVDASVDAHLFTFNVNDDLSLNLHPAFINTAGTNHYAAGIGLHIGF
jgi:hypothetical protein